jgi:hypothetical protein
MVNRAIAAAVAAFGVAVLAFLAFILFGASASAQTPSPTATTGTPHATVTTTATPEGQPTFVPTIVVPGSIYKPGGGDFAFVHPAFERLWGRTDRPVKLGQVSRTWFWGPGPNTPGLLEQYNESPLGNKQRLVQYFDKSRMELNNPQGDPTQAFFVTNGLLTVELISGFIQVGEKDFVKFRPACIPMSGDFGDKLAPTYFGFQKVSNTQAGDHPAADRTGQKAIETIDQSGNTGTDASKANVPGVNFVHYEAGTKHNIPKIFWDFLNSSGRVHNDAQQIVTQTLITPWFFASGLPISEPYWAKARIRGTVMDVMIQAYERRALTYVPTNTPGFQVEMANIGQHYFDWRYRNEGLCPGQPPGVPTPPLPAPTGTVATGTPGTPVATHTPAPTGTPCPNCPTATRTPTQVIPPATVVPPVTSTRTATRTATRTP